MNVEFTSEARDDLFEAAEYYESKEKGLGFRMRDEVARSLTTVATAPYLWREREAGYRRVNCPVFPYYVAYAIRDERKMTRRQRVRWLPLVRVSNNKPLHRSRGPSGF